MNYYGSVGRVDDNADYLLMNAEVMPFMAQEIASISEGCGFDSAQLREFMQDTLSEEMKRDTGIFTASDLTDLIMCGMNGDKEGQRVICTKALDVALSKMGNR